MKFNDCFKLPRLYVDQPLADGSRLELTPGQAHYLKSVLRLKPGNDVRVFNGRDGEWLCTLESLEKKTGTLKINGQFKQQPHVQAPLNLLFAPIKKKNMEFMIEKAVELGVTDLHPVFTARTQNRNLNADRMQSHILEAAEQCERLSIPILHKPATLDEKLKAWDQNFPIHWCAERLENIPPLASCNNVSAFLIGPEGGFDDQENTMLKQLSYIKPTHLGDQILRAETAALYCLSAAKLKQET